MPSKDKRVIEKYCKSPRGIEVMKRGKAKYNSSPKRLLTQQNLHLKKTYNITLEDYKLMFTDQEGVCKICKKLEDKRMLSVDHNHQTGKVRGLLCHRCNTGIGLFMEDVFVLEESIRYLKNY